MYTEFKTNWLIFRKLDPGLYIVRVKVNGNLIPLYQYTSITDADIVVSEL
jgi:hypothetical protein